MVNVPANSGQNWEVLKVKIRSFVIDKLSRMLNEPNLATLIVTEQSLDPFLIEQQTASYMGSLYGTSSNSLWAAFLRHANFKSTIGNLYFCGGSVHPGGGIPLCLKSAKIVSDLISN
jgi:phytoene dehydrogenase-like protein